MNIDLNSLNYLNDEYLSLGFESIYSDNYESINYDSLLFNSIETLRRYRDYIQNIDNLNEEKHKINRLYESACKKHTQLQDLLDKKTKEIKQYEDKCKKYEIKINNLAKQLKDEQDDRKKLKLMIDHRDTLFKHDKKKFECELNRLKEKLSSLVISKSQSFSNIEINENIKKQSALKQRQTWDFVNPQIQDNSKFVI
jgi:chromosome segregation ATPase